MKKKVCGAFSTQSVLATLFFFLPKLTNGHKLMLESRKLMHAAFPVPLILRSSINFLRKEGTEGDELKMRFSGN